MEIVEIDYRHLYNHRQLPIICAAILVFYGIVCTSAVTLMYPYCYYTSQWDAALCNTTVMHPSTLASRILLTKIPD